MLLYLHKQEVLTLNHGMTVMRRAMTIEVNADKKGSYLKDDYLRLDEHYSEKRIQVHVMREYAEVALGAMASALELVLHYFTDSKMPSCSAISLAAKRCLSMPPVKSPGDPSLRI